VKSHGVSLTHSLSAVTALREDVHSHAEAVRDVLPLRNEVRSLAASLKSLDLLHDLNDQVQAHAAAVKELQPLQGEVRDCAASCRAA